LEPFRPEGRIRYNPRAPQRQPREMPEERWRELFAAWRSNRDRAILAIAVSNGARASELLGVRSADLDWGDQLVRVVRKGTQAEQWLPASPDAFVWLRLYLAELGDPLKPDDRVWQTLRRRDHGRGLERQPLNYEALRAVFRRANTLLGANWTMHDLWHTAALRMARDEELSLKDVQTILGHAHLSTTEVYLVMFDEQLVRTYRAFLDRRRATRPEAEYREPSEEEWREFQQHFHTRKLELGECGRPYGTPCKHEFACIRCPSLRVSPSARPRLIEIVANLKDRIQEAKLNGWLGEVEGLQASLNAATSKLVSLDRMRNRRPGGPVNLGIPIIGTE
jgi:hypothetical protein